MAQFLLPLCNAHGGPTWGQFHLSYLPLINFFPHVRKEISGHPGGLTNHPYVRKSTRDTPLPASHFWATCDHLRSDASQLLAGDSQNSLCPLSSRMVSLPLLRESATYAENGESVPVGGFPMSIITYSMV